MNKHRVQAQQRTDGVLNAVRRVPLCSCLCLKRGEAASLTAHLSTALVETTREKTRAGQLAEDSAYTWTPGTAHRQPGTDPGFLLARRGHAPRCPLPLQLD